VLWNPLSFLLKDSIQSNSQTSKESSFGRYQLVKNSRETLEISKNQALISSLQELISQRRELRVVEINRIHRKHSKALSERYEQITKEP
jgi:hypothetical protein